MDTYKILNQILNQDLINLREKFQIYNFDIKIVGGAVRDILMGQVPKDIDLCTDASPKDQIEIYKKFNYRYIPTGIEHGTISVVINDEVYEITSLRVEKDHDGRHATVEFTSDWIEDLSRRDLTINAMALSFDGEMLDPYSGVEDLKSNNIRFVGDAEKRIKEDYLRILRFFRFLGRYGHKKIDEETRYAIYKNAIGLEKISGERIWQEFKKILVHPKINFLLQEMNDTNVLLRVKLPYRQVPSWVVSAYNPITVLASILNEAEIKPLVSRWKLSNNEVVLLTFLVNNKKQNLNIENYEDFLAIRNVPIQLIKELALLQNHKHFINYLQNWNIPVFPINGNDLIEKGYTPGPEMGKILNQLKMLWKDSRFKLTKEELLDKVSPKKN